MDVSPGVPGLNYGLGDVGGVVLSGAWSLVVRASTSGPTSIYSYATKDDHILDAMHNAVLWLLRHDHVHP